jgi:hypothetical protein
VGRTLIIDLAQVRGQFSTAKDALVKALADPLTPDFALFEGGLLADFLEVRGPLLPADEQLRAAAWLTKPRSLYEVESVRPGQGFGLGDIHTGERHEVSERSGSTQVEAGMLVCVHLLGTGAEDDGTIFGGIDSVPDRLRDVTLEMLDRAEPDPYVTIEVLTRRFLPSEVRTAEGDEMRLCTAKLVCASPETWSAGSTANSA